MFGTMKQRSFDASSVMPEGIVFGVSADGVPWFGIASGSGQMVLVGQSFTTRVKWVQGEPRAAGNPQPTDNTWLFVLLARLGVPWTYLGPSRKADPDAADVKKTHDQIMAVWDSPVGTPTTLTPEQVEDVLRENGFVTPDDEEAALSTPAT